MSDRVWECSLTDEYGEPFSEPWGYIPYLDRSPSAAAEAFAEYAWHNHDMWECGDEGFEVLVRKRGELETVWRVQIAVEAVPQFNATWTRRSTPASGEDR